MGIAKAIILFTCWITYEFQVIIANKHIYTNYNNYPIHFCLQLMHMKIRAIASSSSPWAWKKTQPFSPHFSQTLFSSRLKVGSLTTSCSTSSTNDLPMRVTNQFYWDSVAYEVLKTHLSMLSSVKLHCLHLYSKRLPWIPPLLSTAYIRLLLGFKEKTDSNTIPCRNAS